VAGKTVAVTGASGYVAGEVIKQLLEKGYSVRGTVRSIKDETKVKHLTDTFHGLQLFEADLLKEGSFDECFAGVSAVFHTASPFLRTWSDPQKDLIDPALNGTRNVLSSVEKNLGTIKTLIVTSSAAAIVAQKPELAGADKVWTEKDWNTTSTLTEGPYRLSKYLAEKAAWDWGEGKPIKVLAVNPCFVLGPLHSSRTDSTSVATVIEFLNGTTKKTGTNNTCFGAIDIRNVGEAHVACLENPNANGRYLLSSDRGIPHLELVQSLKAEFGQYPLPEKQNGEIPYHPRYSSEKAKAELGIKFIPIEQSMVEMARSIINFGLVKKIE